MNPNTTTLQQAKNWLRERLSKGDKCPCCNQHAKMYQRKIHSSSAYVLILIAKSGNRDFFHVHHYLDSINVSSSVRGDYQKLTSFKLLESSDEIREDGSNRNGFYRITEKGLQFVNGEITVPEHVNIYNNKVFGFSEKHITIRDALNKKFDYSELMGIKPIGPANG